MKIFIASSKHFYHKIPEIKSKLEEIRYKVSLPNSYDKSFKEEEIKEKRLEAHIKWKSDMLRRDKQNITLNDTIFVLNFEKNGQKNYIGGVIFIEIIKAWELGKKIFLYNEIPDNIFRDELLGINPNVVYGDLEKIK